MECPPGILLGAPRAPLVWVLRFNGAHGAPYRLEQVSKEFGRQQKIL
ncbi:MAG: hypothetical protein HOB14_09180 [Gammaproteobacteria bacterium]|jgi:hypothetical protein|nr:hypothetical protein [Gammaproteobacteria bacterium]MBT7046345.1 hypothetical protein [Gammaproteobacteria bacterium]